MRRALAVLALLLGLSVVAAPAASAHARLVGTSPVADSILDAPPTDVVLRFSEPVDVGLGGIRVVDPAGGRADDGEVERADGGTSMRVQVDASDEGTYTVAYSVTSEDGHIIDGSFLFSVGQRSDPAELASQSRPVVRFVAGIGRWLGFAGVVLLVGLATFPLIAGSRSTRRLAPVALGAGAAAGAGALLVLVTNIAIAASEPLLGVGGRLGDAITSTRPGTLGAIRIALALLAVAVAVLWRSGRLADVAAHTSIGAFGVGSVVLIAIGGHAWTASARAAAVLVDVVHLVAIGAWLGGVVALYFVLRDDPDGRRAARRFSLVALFLIGLIVVTGALTTLLQIDTLDALLDSQYGRLLLIKLVVFALLMGIASLSRSMVRQQPHEVRSLRRLVLAEAMVALVVIGVAAALVNQPPGVAAAPQPVSVTADTDGGPVASVRVQVVPATVGPNDIHLYFFDSSGLPTSVDAVEMTVAQGDIPPRKVTITPQTPDHVSAYDVTLPSVGTWTLHITAVAAGASSTVDVDVPIG